MKTKFVVNFGKLHSELIFDLISGFKIIFNF